MTKKFFAILVIMCLFCGLYLNQAMAYDMYLLSFDIQFDGEDSLEQNDIILCMGKDDVLTFEYGKNCVLNVGMPEGEYTFYFRQDGKEKHSEDINVKVSGDTTVICKIKSTEDDVLIIECSTDSIVPAWTAEQGNITAENNKEFAHVLLNGYENTDETKEFVSKYKGFCIEFDCCVLALDNHGSYSTRYDVLLLSTANKEAPMLGLHCVIIDENFSGMHVEGTDSVKIGKYFHVIAEVEKYDGKEESIVIEPVKMVYIEK